MSALKKFNLKCLRSELLGLRGTFKVFFGYGGGGAKKVAELGSGWTRMTSLIRVKAVDGKIEAEQDDSRLGNPNQLDTITKAKKQLRRCATTGN